jgi:hypothetical protein
LLYFVLLELWCFMGPPYRIEVTGITFLLESSAVGKYNDGEAEDLFCIAFHNH